MKVGITGQSGFIGSHLTYNLRLKPDEIELIPFHKEYFQDIKKLENFVSKCDCIVHLAAMNRGDENVLVKCNIDLVTDLITAIENKNHKPHIIFSSSNQERNDSAYGTSKKEGRRLFEDWSAKTGGKFTGLTIENVFGAFGVPFYNSVVATFCYQLTHDEEPSINVDAALNLIYVDDLAENIYKVICGNDEASEKMGPVAVRKVSEVLAKCVEFRDGYLNGNVIPELSNDFDIALFNTFRSYLEYNHFPASLEVHSDNRGWLFEVAKSHSGGQSFYSMTNPGVTRGNHFHTRKVERFCVVQGEAVIRLRKLDTEKVIEYKVSGNAPAFVDIPIYHTHNITNIGESELLTLFWCNEIYNPDDADTFFEEV